jgi:RNA polymerase sigma factor (sigma-70 family)
MGLYKHACLKPTPEWECSSEAFRLKCMNADSTLPSPRVAVAFDEPSPPASTGARVFATTRWTVVLRAGGPTSEGSAAALEQLCRTYWYPLYSFARRNGLPAHDAEDMTQSFFAFLLEKDAISRADRERGRFRSFLLAAFKNFQANRRSHDSAAKRGGGEKLVSFDEMQAEGRYQSDSRTTLSPECLYDKQWAASLLDEVMSALRREYAVLKKESLFDMMRGIIWGGRDESSYAVLALQAGLSEGALKVAVHRMRKRLQERLRQEVAQTVATPGEIDDELRHLLAALSA